MDSLFNNKQQEIKMTTNELLDRLHECRNNMEGSTDELAQTTFDTLNMLISEIEDCGVLYE